MIYSNWAKYIILEDLMTYIYRQKGFIDESRKFSHSTDSADETAIL